MRASTFLCSLLLPLSAAHSEPFFLKEGDVVGFLGGTNMVRMQDSGHLETLLSREYAKERPRFRDLSWEGDTVSHLSTERERWRTSGYGHMKPEAFGDLRKQLKTVGVSVAFVQFGKMEVLSGLSVEEFVSDYAELIDLLREGERRIVILSPIPFGASDKRHTPDLTVRNPDLARFSEAARELAASKDAVYVDLFEPLLGAVRQAEFMDHGLHLASGSHAKVASLVAGQLGLGEAPDWDALEELRESVREKHRLWKEYWRPANWKCLFGDDSKRIFSVGTVGELPTLQEEWRRYPGLLAAAETVVWKTEAGARFVPPKLTPKPTSGSHDADLERELEAFHCADGYAVNLFASEELGIANPLCIHWDSRGRLYVACSDVYPQVVPGELANDRIVVLEDTDADGKADKSTLFADRLNIPTGIEVGHGGVYVAQGTELLFLRDTDGDLVADERRVLLSGFGNGDSHQTANSLVWSPEGDLYFCQGDGIESRVETPHGVSSLFQAGVFRLRPLTMQLDGLLDDFMGPGNPWGVAFDDYGQSVVIDGAGGVSYLTPATLPVKHRHRLPRIGNPGGYCGVEHHDGEFLIGDYKPNRVSRFVLEEDGGGFKLHWKEPLLRSEHGNFRPIDVKSGPDGALYVVDWYNPVICHQDDYFRHPDRDKVHGRVWRVSRKGEPSARPQIAGKGITELVPMLASANRWVRHHAKMELTNHDEIAVGSALVAWRTGATPDEKLDFEAAAAAAFVESPEPALLSRIMKASEPRVRAFSARLVGRWYRTLENHEALLQTLVQDEHPLVRMEAVLACGRIPKARSVEIAAMAVESPVDRWIDYALTQAAHHLKTHWAPAFAAGELTFDGSNTRRAAILAKAGSESDLENLRTLATNSDLALEARVPVLRTLVSVGGDEEMRVVLDPDSYKDGNRYDRGLHTELMRELGRSREEIGGVAKELLGALAGSAHPEVQAEALRLAGVWDVDALEETVEAAVRNSANPLLRVAAFEALSEYGSDNGRALLVEVLETEQNLAIRRPALVALSRIDLEEAARHAPGLLILPPTTGPVLEAFLSRDTGESALVDVLSGTEMERESAERVLQTLQASGRPAPELTRVLESVIGAIGTVPGFDPKFIEELLEEAQAKGDTGRGKEVYERASMNCVSCHAIDGKGGKMGPDLSAAGTTIPPARLIEEVIWPRRQVKEGFSLLQVTLKDRSVSLGYERTTRNKEVLQLQDFATGEMRKISRKNVAETRDAGSAMPPGLVAQLSRSELRDLIRYLMQLGKSADL